MCVDQTTLRFGLFKNGNTKCYAYTSISWFQLNHSHLKGDRHNVSLHMSFSSVHIPFRTSYKCNIDYKQNKETQLK